MSFVWSVVSAGTELSPTDSLEEVKTNTDALATNLGVNPYAWKHMPITDEFDGITRGGYTENDTNNRFSIDNTTITITSLDATDDDHYVYKDYTASHFSGDVAFYGKLKIDAGADNSSRVEFFGLQNNIEDITDLQGNDRDYIICYFDKDAGGTNRIYIDEGVNGSGNVGVAANFNPVEGTQYWWTFIRNEAYGDYGRAVVYFYTDSSRDTLVGFAPSVLRAKADFQYHFAVSSWGAAAGGALSGSIKAQSAPAQKVNQAQVEDCQNALDYINTVNTCSSENTGHDDSAEASQETTQDSPENSGAETSKQDAQDGTYKGTDYGTWKGTDKSSYYTPN